MLTIDLQGARAFLKLLPRIAAGQEVSETEVEETLAANRFFIDFYSGWDGCSREIIKNVVCHFHQPEQVSQAVVPVALAQGFRQAIQDAELLESRMAWLGEINLTQVAQRILGFLPENTPLDSVIHITVDAVNNAFASQNEMGVSLLKGMNERKTFEEAVTHELHHVGFRYWSAKDAARQRLVQEHNGRSVAVMHVENLLMEGMANDYCSPGYVFAVAHPAPGDPFQARLARLQREEAQFFTRAEAVLAQCLEPGATYDPWLEALKTIALDMEEMMLPAYHYLGARMVQTMERYSPRSQIVGCVQDLKAFLPFYNSVAHAAGGFVFDEILVGEFMQIWEGK